MRVLFVGEYRHSIDAKGRLFVPVKLREELGQTFMVCKGFDRCLMLHPMESWQKFVEKLEELTIVGQKNIRRYFFSSAFEATVDSQGRVIIPPDYRQFAGLEKNVCLIGNNRHLELWDEAAWDADLSSNMNNEDIAAELLKLGF